LSKYSRSFSPLTEGGCSGSATPLSGNGIQDEAGEPFSPGGNPADSAEMVQALRCWIDCPSLQPLTILSIISFAHGTATGES